MADWEAGTAKWFSEGKGYGVIARESGEDVFVHFSAVEAEGFRTLHEGDRVGGGGRRQLSKYRNREE